MLYRPKVLWLETALREAAKKQEAMDQLKRHATELEAQVASLTDKLASEQERHQTLLDKEKQQGKYVILSSDRTVCGAMYSGQSTIWF